MLIKLLTLWRNKKAKILLLIWISAVVVAYRETFHDLFNLWRKFDESLGHGFLVILVCIYLFYQNIRSFKGEIKPNQYFAVPVILLSLVWAMSYSLGIEVIQQLILPLILFLSLFLLLGKEFTWKQAIPIFLLYFAIPIWDYLNNGLLLMTTIAVQYVIELTGITAYIQGNSIFLPSGEIVIASGCSGLRYFIVGSFLAVLSGYLYFDLLNRRILILFMTIVMTLIANWARVYIVIIVAYMTNMQSPLVSNHELLGWVIFVIFMLPLFYLNYKYGQEENRNISADKKPHINEKSSYLIPGTLFIVSIYAGPVLVNIQEHISTKYNENMISISAYGHQWTMQTTAKENGWMTKIKDPDQKINQIYEKDNVKLSLTIYSYYKNKDSREILPYFNKIYDQYRWVKKSMNTFEISVMGKSIKFNELLLVNKYTSDKRIIIFQYNVGGFNTTNYYTAKLYQIPAYYLGRPHAIITTASIICRDSCDKSFDSLHEFANEVISTFSYFQ